MVEQSPGKGEITAEDAGRLGGLKTKQKMGADHYREMSKKGQQKLLEKYGGLEGLRAHLAAVRHESSLKRQRSQSAPTTEVRAPITAREAGRMGGRAVKESYPGFHAAIGQMGGESLLNTRPGFHSEIGRKGGQATSSQHQGDGYYSQLGRTGGEALRNARGSDYYSRIGKLPHKRRGRQRLSSSVLQEPT